MYTIIELHLRPSVPSEHHLQTRENSCLSKWYQVHCYFIFSGVIDEVYFTMEVNDWADYLLTNCIIPPVISCCTSASCPVYIGGFNLAVAQKSSNSISCQIFSYMVCSPYLRQHTHAQLSLIYQKVELTLRLSVLLLPINLFVPLNNSGV